MDFGTLIWVHRGKFSAGGWTGYLGVTLTVLGLLAIGNAALASPAETAELRLNVIALPLGALCLILPIYRWRQSVAVYERGLVWTRLHKTLRVPRESVRGARVCERRSALLRFDVIEIELNLGQVSIIGIDQPTQLCNLVNALAEAPHRPESALGSWRASGKTTGDRSRS